MRRLRHFLPPPCVHVHPATSLPHCYRDRTPRALRDLRAPSGGQVCLLGFLRHASRSLRKLQAVPKLSAIFGHTATLALAVGTAPPQRAPRRWCRTFRAVLPSLLARPCQHGPADDDPQGGNTGTDRDGRLRITARPTGCHTAFVELAGDVRRGRGLRVM